LPVKRTASKPFDPISRRVREALFFAAGKVLDELPYGPESKRDGKDQFRRLGGAYGAELRQLATDQPDLSAAELVAAIIAPAEFPDDPEVAELTLSVLSGARDRVRRSRYGTGGADLSVQIPPDLSERIEEVRRCAREGMAAQEARPRPEPEPFVREYSVVPRFVYDALRRPGAPLD
jgi:hypothetical protein